MTNENAPSYDAVLLLSFGGPEGPDDVVPFLENVTRGRNIPRERLEEVGKHYFLFGGVSPINAQCRQLLGALGAELERHGPALPIYWGNRNWHPMLAATVGQMADDGIRRAVAVATSAYSSYSACRQYLEDIDAARAAVGPRAPLIGGLVRSTRRGVCGVRRAGAHAQPAPPQRARSPSPCRRSPGRLERARSARR